MKPDALRAWRDAPRFSSPDLDAAARRLSSYAHTERCKELSAAAAAWTVFGSVSVALAGVERSTATHLRVFVSAVVYFIRTNTGTRFAIGRAVHSNGLRPR